MGAANSGNKLSTYGHCPVPTREAPTRGDNRRSDPARLARHKSTPHYLRFDVASKCCERQCHEARGPIKASTFASTCCKRPHHEACRYVLAGAIASICCTRPCRETYRSGWASSLGRNGQACYARVSQNGARNESRSRQRQVIINAWKRVLLAYRGSACIPACHNIYFLQQTNPHRNNDPKIPRKGDHK